MFHFASKVWSLHRLLQLSIEVSEKKHILSQWFAETHWVQNEKKIEDNRRYISNNHWGCICYFTRFNSFPHWRAYAIEHRLPYCEEVAKEMPK